jgi:anti-sigma factor RsiW
MWWRDPNQALAGISFTRLDELNRRAAVTSLVIDAPSRWVPQAPRDAVTNGRPRYVSRRGCLSVERPALVVQCPGAPWTGFRSTGQQLKPRDAFTLAGQREDRLHGPEAQLRMTTVGGSPGRQRP